MLEDHLDLIRLLRRCAAVSRREICPEVTLRGVGSG